MDTVDASDAGLEEETLDEVLVVGNVLNEDDKNNVMPV